MPAVAPWGCGGLSHAHTHPPSNTLNRDSPPPPQFARHGAHTRNHRASTATPAGLARGSAPSSFLQGHPPSLRFGHPDVTTEATETSTHPPNRCSYVFRKRPQGVTRTLSAAKQGGAERPGDGCPCVGAEETCSAPRSLRRREVPTHPTPVGTRANTVFQASSTGARGNIYTSSQNL